MMNMIPTKARKRTLLAAIACLIVLAIGFLLVQTSLSNAQRLIIGPFRGAVLLVLTLLLLFVLDLRFSGSLGRIWRDWALAAAATLWLLVTLLWAEPRMQQISLAAKLVQFNFLPLILLLTGLISRVRKMVHIQPCAEKELSARTLLILTLLFIFISLIPVLRSGFYWDDSIFSAQIPALKTSGGSIWQQTWDEMFKYAQRGRINPFATFQFIIFYLFPDPRAYKLLLLLLILINALLFNKFSERFFSGSKLSGVLILVLLPLCFQLRIYHDPITGYYGLMQMMFAELMGSLILFDLYLEKRRKKHLVGSLILFTIGLMSYEMFYPFILLIVLLAWRSCKSLKKLFLQVLPYGIIEAVLLAVSFGLRQSYAAAGEVLYEGTNFSLNFGKILSTWVNQMAAAFPLNYRLAGNDAVLLGKLVPAGEIFNLNLSSLIHDIQWIDLLSLCLIMFLFIAQKKSGQLPKITGFHWIFSFTLLGLSALVIAVSEKYQNQIIAGLGYLPVYFGYFAAAMLLFLTGASLFQKIKTPAPKEDLYSCGVQRALSAESAGEPASDRIDE